jgi:hypothetical protein
MVTDKKIFTYFGTHSYLFIQIYQAPFYFLPHFHAYGFTHAHAHTHTYVVHPCIIRTHVCVQEYTCTRKRIMYTYHDIPCNKFYNQQFENQKLIK